MAGILGKKIGMTQLYRENLEIAVTAIEAGPCCVTQVKTVEKDKYNAVQIGFGESKKLGKAEKGHLKENGNYRYLREFRLADVKDYAGRTKNRCGDVQSRRHSPGRGHFQGQRVCRWSKEVSFQGWTQDARPVRQASCPGFDRLHHYAGQGIQRPAHGRAHGRSQGYCAQSGSGRSRHRQECIAAEGCGSRRQGRDTAD